ncbi:MAG: molybdopterin cofactor-binding domain-containing protein [Sphaerochaetaceae bacterium]
MPPAEPILADKQLKKAAENLKENILVEAALQLGEDVEHLALRYPQHVYSQITGKSLSFAQISHQATSGVGRGQLVGYGSFATMDAAIPYGAHFVQVAVNTKTGQINVQKYYALQDAGTPINPELALCQLYGAALKSIGHTLYEEMILDEEGRCLTADLSSYGVPMISELPEDFQAVLIDEDDEFGPFGAKSISEIATNGAAPAIALAVHDAVGIWLRSWPFTSEKVLRKLKVLQDSQQY